MRTLLLSTALSLTLALAAPAAAQDYEAMGANMEQSMAAAQAQAQRPGDDELTCEQLEEEIATTMQDPAVQSAVAANGADAQAQIDQMNAARGRMRAQMAASMFMGIASSFIPGLGYAQMAQQQMQAAQYQRQQQQNMAQMQVMMERMSGIMPQMMRGQRVYELGQAKQCAFTQQQTAPQ
ncbi:MAG: hypothetical protein ACT4OF_09405 [Caulobacteraceae bacterium]